MGGRRVRIGVRHGWLEAGADYHQIQDDFQSQLPGDAQVYNEFHALIVRHGKEVCQSNPRCRACCLAKSCRGKQA